LADSRSTQGGSDAPTGNARDNDSDRQGAGAEEAGNVHSTGDTGDRDDEQEAEARQQDGSEAADSDGRSTQGGSDARTGNAGDYDRQGAGAEEAGTDGARNPSTDTGDRDDVRSNDETDPRLEQAGRDELMDSRLDSGEGEDRLSGENYTGSNETEDRAAHAERRTRFVAFSLRFNNIQYSLLAAEPSMMEEVKSRVADKVANTANVLPEAVEVDLRPGSVIANASIYPPSGVSAEAVQQSLSESPQDLMLQKITDGVSSVPGIDAVMTGNVTVTLLSDPVVREVEESISHAQRSKKRSVIISSIAGGVAMLLCM